MIARALGKKVPRRPHRHGEVSTQVGRGASGPGWTTCVLGSLPFPLRDFRTVSTYLARMSQMAWDPCAIVFLVHVFKGVLHVAGHARDTFGTLTGVPSRR